MHDSITDVPGVRVGHWTNLEAATGCTVVLCPQGAVGGVDVRGSAPGTRETDLLRPGNLVQQAHAVLLSGGSAFGLDAASGVMRYLEERGFGFKVGSAVVPIVPAAILFDLGVATPGVRPGPQEGYQACLNASDGPVAQGSVGAGTGATVGKALGSGQATKGGVGSASLDLGGGIIVGAIVAVNAFGSVVDPKTSRVIAGPRRQDDAGFLDTIELLITDQARRATPPLTNTTLGVVATSATLTKEQANKMASIAHDGFALAIRPVHMMEDGDVVFALATGASQTTPAPFQRILAATIVVVAQAIVNAVEHAQGLKGVPSAREVVKV
ncbi:MAG: peptidase S58 family protein [Dehalococcoidia bacterium]|nr:peptidase S58 family protein [Dehalococcoidia bacterium]